MSYFTDKFMSFCRFIGIEYISNKTWMANGIDESDLYDLQTVTISSDSTISVIAFNSVVMNGFYLKTLYDLTKNSDSNVRKVAMGLLFGGTCFYAYKLTSSFYNKLKAIDKMKKIINDQGLALLPNAVTSAVTPIQISPDSTNGITVGPFVITPAASLYANTGDGMDDNIDDNSYELNDTSHPIFNVVAHGFDPYLIYRLHLKHPSEFIDSPPFKTSEDALNFANYIDDLVESEDMFDYIEYLYSTDIKEIYQFYISEDDDIQENNVVVEAEADNEANNEVESIEI